jgi:hypothetical protein
VGTAAVGYGASTLDFYLLLAVKVMRKG